MFTTSIPVRSIEPSYCGVTNWTLVRNLIKACVTARACEAGLTIEAIALISESNDGYFWVSQSVLIEIEKDEEEEGEEVAP